MEKYLEELIVLANKAYHKNEIPVGCVIVREDKIIARAYNLRETKKDVLAHAEIIAIKKATKALNDWRLADCTMYVTLAPCKMCRAIIEESRISKIYYLIKNDKTETEKSLSIYEKISNEKFEEQYKKTFNKLFQKIR